MNVPRQSRVARILRALVIIGVIFFIVYGLYLANRPVVAPWQGQIDARYVDVAPKIVGRIAELHVHEGDDVKPGDLLVTLDSPELAARLAQAEAAQGAAAANQQLLEDGTREEELRTAQANWQRAVSATKLAQSTFARINALYKDGLVSRQRNDEVDTAYRSAVAAEHAARAQYDLAQNGFRKEQRAAAAEATRGTAAAVEEVTALAADTALKAPLAAEVDKVVLHQGELATPGFPVMSLVDLDDVWAVFNLREDELAAIAMHSRITGTVPALGNHEVILDVYYISPKGEYATWRATRQSSGYDVKTFEVRARPVDKVLGLRPGMSVLVARR